MRRACAAYCLTTCAVAPEVTDLLVRYRWPGNVRELENVVERVAILGGGGRLEVEGLPDDLRAALTVAAPATPVANEGPHPVATLAEVEPRHIIEVLARHNGRRKATAEALGIDVNALWRELKRYGVA